MSNEQHDIATACPRCRQKIHKKDEDAGQCPLCNLQLLCFLSEKDWQTWIVSVEITKTAWELTPLFNQASTGDKQAFQKLTELATKGDDLAKRCLGVIFWEGRKIAQDKVKALEWYSQTIATLGPLSTPVAVERLQVTASSLVASNGRLTGDKRQELETKAHEWSIYPLDLEVVLASFGPIKPKKGEKTNDPETGMQLVWVPDGIFEMGDILGEGNESEQPVHEVRVSGFWLGKFPVTYGEWKKVMPSNPSLVGKGDQHPVVNVSWNDAQEFIQRLNDKMDNQYRLPTEAEWEYAARSCEKKERWAGTSDVTELGRYAWFGADKKGCAQPVGQKEPNDLGLHEMSGTLWEWVQDRRHDDYREAPKDGSAWEDGESEFRIIRGGSWRHAPEYTRIAVRSWALPDLHSDSLGFRLALFPAGEDDI